MYSGAIEKTSRSAREGRCCVGGTQEPFLWSWKSFGVQSFNIAEGMEKLRRVAAAEKVAVPEVARAVRLPISCRPTRMALELGVSA